jgi:hypothetical protein
MNMQNQNIPLNGNNMMEMIKTQLMTFTMMKSMNGNNDKSGQDNGMRNMIYIFLATAIIDFICKSVLPGTMREITKLYNSKINNNLLKDLILKQVDSKSSSIIIHINISDHENKIGQSLLDFITNHNNTNHVIFKKQNFILNQTDIIEICDELFIKSSEINESRDDSVTSVVGIQQTIELFSYTKTMNELRAFLNKLSRDYEIKIKNKLGDNVYYFNQVPMNAHKDGNNVKDYTRLPNNCVFTMKKFQTNRKFSNLFGPEISLVKKRVEFFIQNKKWYDVKGIPYTLGLLLSGQAGAGKTSTVKCLANETRRHIININLNNDITKTQMDNLFYNDEISVINVSTGQTEKYCIPLDQRIYVLEDIDCQGDLVMERNSNNKVEENTPDIERLTNIKTNPNKPDTNGNTSNIVSSQKLDLSFLLNLLDGVLEIPGRIVIMTSNYIKMLDQALIRPGRIDVIADFKKCLNQTVIEMIEFFYDINITNEDRKRIIMLHDELVSPAELGKFMFENIDNYLNVIDILEKNSHLKSSALKVIPNVRPHPEFRKLTSILDIEGAPADIIKSSLSTIPEIVPSTIPEIVPSTIPEIVPSTIPEIVPSTIPETIPESNLYNPDPGKDVIKSITDGPETNGATPFSTFSTFGPERNRAIKPFSTFGPEPNGATPFDTFSAQSFGSTYYTD